MYINQTDLRLAHATVRSAATRQRLRRARRKRGEAVFHLTLNENQIIEALICAGRLSENASEQRSAVERAISGLLTDWSVRWLKK
jgi:hypothetical protein